MQQQINVMLTYSPGATQLFSAYYDELSESYISSKANKPRSCLDRPERTRFSHTFGGCVGGNNCPTHHSSLLSLLFPNCHAQKPCSFSKLANKCMGEFFPGLHAASRTLPFRLPDFDREAVALPLTALSPQLCRQRQTINKVVRE